MSIDTASISGTLLGVLCSRLLAAAEPAQCLTLIGSVETATELSDSDASVTKRHAALQRVPAHTDDGSADGTAEGEQVLGVVRMRRDSSHVLSLADVQFLRDTAAAGRHDLLLLLTSIESEVGSEEVQYTLFCPCKSQPRAVPLAVANLVSSSQRFENIATLCLRHRGPPGAGDGSAQTQGVAARAAHTPTAIEQYAAGEYAALQHAVDEYTGVANDVRDAQRQVARLQAEIAKLRAERAADDDAPAP